MLLALGAWRFLPRGSPQWALSVAGWRSLRNAEGELFWHKVPLREGAQHNGEMQEWSQIQVPLIPSVEGPRERYAKLEAQTLRPLYEKSMRWIL